MSKKLYEETDIQSVADAIREKNGLTITYKVSEMAQAIKDIPSGGGATEPYREDTLNNNYIVSSKLYGYTTIPSYFLTNSTKLTAVTSNTATTRVGDQSFSGCSSLSSFDFSNIKFIGYKAFSNCKFTDIVFGEQLQSFNTYSFMNNTSLATVVFRGRPSSIYSSVFYGCSKLTSIKVPWSEGEVANAPWGATKATITYNYIGE